MALVTEDRERFPDDPWKLVETTHRPGDAGTLETLFAVGNGHLGIRGAHWSAADVELPGSFINGLHEIWDIRHAENAFGFARTGQRILYIPDANNFTVVIDGEALTLAESTVEDYRRTVDFSTGIYECRITWLSRSGARVTTTERRAVGYQTRGGLGISLEIDADREVSADVTSSVINRQDQPVEDHSEHDPRRSGRHAGRVLLPLRTEGSDGSLRLSWEAAVSKQQVGIAVDHWNSAGLQPFETLVDQDDSSVRYVLALNPGEPFRLEKSVSYAVARFMPEAAVDTAETAEATLKSVPEIFAESEQHFGQYWATSDIQVGGPDGLQQAIRWNLFQLAQATARADVGGIPAKGVSGSGYEGHYFWDQEVYLLPYLTYTNPDGARKVLEFRHSMLPEARIRAKELSVDGALFPWRTINGLEASAYYAAGTAQFHIAAAIAFATNRYLWASDDADFRDGMGAELLIETARMWVSLGFFGKDGLFHIHGVTGPDEYTAVVNDNLYTNVMARFNLRAAAALDHPGITDDERQLWQAAADLMQLPFDERLQVHSQDNDFMTLEQWDWTTPRDKYPLLLHFHPLVIYRHQVLKQADTVLAMFLQWQDFSAEEKHRAFDFYDPITTGDSTLSACVQGIMAAEVGYTKAALDHFTNAVFIDLDDSHRNTIDGVHIASAGGVWSSLVCGFAGLRDQGPVPFFDPRLPQEWSELSFHVRLRGALLSVDLTPGLLTLRTDGLSLDVDVRGKLVQVGPEGVAVPLEPVPVPEPTVFPCGLPTASIPVVQTGV
ncbi:glycosyl hydrolase family 65 protein [Pseudarthrobacter sp. J75]|uniref:glycoside hydrolase family 65 protein n=1 Tax=unclassified Pseudarthrobacter TaxID=2647000 RepID=UPI002E800632|nr:MULTISPECIES: glycosyl hydrolase family 65 protein [unclassified Pseudarthrobacter]MEE2523565.1 glycosyl hydrolase family 65 protein [Pseudarthrobacter sp. J47]MEE2530547.1 glycosyl hydrolase family 65 protein [Pseudarthrobacter sp. J75]MEE2570247.1 glycosyl hydrolase family 65 protein [Pseudarthrobacter sp. J64]